MSRLLDAPDPCPHYPCPVGMSANGRHTEAMRGRTMGDFALYRENGVSVGERPGLPGVTRSERNGEIVRIKSEHPRGPHLAEVIGRYMREGAYYVWVPGLRLFTVVRSHDIEVVQ